MKLARAALIASVAIAWLNYLLTSRWAHVPGSVHGPKQSFYVIALLALSVLAWRLRGVPAPLGRLPLLVSIAGCAVVLAGLLCWFPPSTWATVPFLDDWPPRYQSTLDGVAMLKSARFSGWNWDFLGGYPTVSDVTQDLTIWAFVPMLVFGPQLGFHVTHVLLFACIPVLVWWDLRRDRADARDVALLAAGLSALLSANYSYFLIRSGDTNSLTGTVAALMTIVAARAARERVPGGGPALLLALTLANYSHRGFFIYSILLVGLDAAVARDIRAAVRAALAVGVAVIAGLPVTYDLYRYPSYFIANNVALHPAPFSAASFARKIYYNIELLLRPGRWFNDFTGLANIFIPVIAFVTYKARGRPQFFAAAVLLVLFLVRFNYESFGYLFLRPVVLLPVLLGPPLAWFLARQAGSRALASALLLFVALYVQIWWGSVPHLTDVREFNPALVSRLSGLPGALIALENGWHRDADADPATATASTPFPAHFEALIPAATGKRLYAGKWDGWQWTPYRQQVLANGAFQGRALRDVPLSALDAEFQRWDIAHAVVWSDAAKTYFGASSAFQLVWTDGIWSDYQRVGTQDGRPTPAALVQHDPGGGRMHLSHVRRGERIIVLTNFHPAWRIRDAELGLDLPIIDANGQLAFEAPRDGDYDVRLIYPARRWLIALSALALVFGSLWLRRSTEANGSRDYRR